MFKGDAWTKAVEFEDVVPIIDSVSELWGGYEYKEPDSINWTNLYNFVDFVANSDTADFNKNYSNCFDVDNWVDYYIFMSVFTINGLQIMPLCV